MQVKRGTYSGVSGDQRACDAVTLTGLDEAAGRAGGGGLDGSALKSAINAGQHMLQGKSVALTGGREVDMNNFPLVSGYSALTTALTQPTLPHSNSLERKAGERMY